MKAPVGGCTVAQPNLKFNIMLTNDPERDYVIPVAPIGARFPKP